MYTFFRSLQKLRKALPSMPVKRAAVLSANTDPKRIPSSPAVQKFHVDSSYNTTDSACLKDIKEMVDSMKHKRDNASRTTVKILASAINGESVKKAKCVTDLSEKLGI